MVIILDSGQCQPQFPLDTFTKKVKESEKKYNFGPRNPDQGGLVSPFLIVVASPASKVETSENLTQTDFSSEAKTSFEKVHLGASLLFKVQKVLAFAKLECSLPIPRFSSFNGKSHG